MGMPRVAGGGTAIATFDSHGGGVSSGSAYQVSKIAINQSAYVPVPAGRGGGLDQLPCGSNRSSAGGSNPRSARYTSIGSLRRSIVHSSPRVQVAGGAGGEALQGEVVLRAQRTPRTQLKKSITHWVCSR